MSIRISIDETPIMLQACNICFENKDNTQMSRCSNCIEAGISCYDCDKKWVEQNKDPSICSICKEKTKQNISDEVLELYNSMNHNNVDIETQRQNTNELSSNHHRNQNVNYDDEVSYNDFNSCSKFLCWIIICLSMSWLFATFSYFVIFRMKKNFINNFHIAIGCGSIIGVPLVVLFRKFFKKNCLPNNNNN